MRSHSSETSGNEANVDSQKSHCFCLAWLWHSEGLQKHLYAITHGMMVLPHHSKRQVYWCKPLEHQTRACVITKTLVNENWGDFPNARTVLHSTARTHVHPCRYLFASPGFVLAGAKATCLQEMMNPSKDSVLWACDLPSIATREHQGKVCCKLYNWIKSFQVQADTSPDSFLKLNFCPISFPQRKVQHLLPQNTCWEPCPEHRVHRQVCATAEIRNEGKNILNSRYQW